MDTAAYQGFAVPYTTQNAGTVILAMIPGRPGLRARVMAFRYTSGATSHSLTFMRPKGKTTLSASVAKGATSIILASDPGAWGSAKTVAADPIANNDYIGYLQDDNTWAYNKLTGTPTANADGTYTIAVSATGAAITKSSGRYIYYFGIYTDSDPNSGLPHPLFKTPLSSTKLWENYGAPYVMSLGAGDPILVYSDNAINQGYIEDVAVLYA